MTLPNLSLVREFEAAHAWWLAAGVDCDFADDATAWLADAPLEPSAAQGTASSTVSRNAPVPGAPRSPSPPRLAPEPAPAPPSSRLDLLGDSPPTDLAEFRQWWVEEPKLDTARVNPRIPPRGEHGAALMVLVPQPEEHDRERLLEGPQGRLLNNILAAMGLDDSAVYIAAALPSHTPMADLTAIGPGGMDAVLAHHIALVAPQRVLALGTDLGTFLTPVNDYALRKINQEVINRSVMISETLEAMMQIPRLKARFWKRLIEWPA
jgi:DNA polymerase